MVELLSQFAWVIHLLAFVGVYVLLRNVLHIDAGKFFATVLHEIRALISFKFNVGSMNLLGLLVILFFGVFVIVFTKIAHIIEYLTKVIGGNRTAELQSDASGLVMFFILVGLLFFRLCSLIETQSVANVVDYSRRSCGHRPS